MSDFICRCQFYLHCVSRTFWLWQGCSGVASKFQSEFVESIFLKQICRNEWVVVGLVRASETCSWTFTSSASVWHRSALVPLLSPVDGIAQCRDSRRKAFNERARLLTCLFQSRQSVCFWTGWSGGFIALIYHVGQKTIMETCVIMFWLSVHQLYQTLGLQMWVTV